METAASQTGIGNQMNRLNLRNARAQTQMTEAQAAAARRAPPLKLQFGPGLKPGYMPDVTRMSGAQRQMYLPQQAGIGGFPAPSQTFASTRAAQAGQAAGEIDASSQYLSQMRGGFLPGGGQLSAGAAWAGPQSPGAQAQRRSAIEDAFRLWQMKAQSGL
jgi:hypothetical protein